jgi:hypothetical protein
MKVSGLKGQAAEGNPPELQSAHVGAADDNIIAKYGQPTTTSTTHKSHE